MNFKCSILGSLSLFYTTEYKILGEKTSFFCLGAQKARKH